MTYTCPEPDLRLIRARNPSAMTGAGTNTYIVGRGTVCVIDPGPQDETHLQAIMAALDHAERVECILVTHSHLDHSPLARPLAQMTGARIMAYGDSLAGRSALMSRLASQKIAGGGEGVDTTFQPDHLLADGQIVPFGKDEIRAIWTPGHMANHMCFEWRGAVFSGDHVLGWTTSLVSPPDGDLGAYMRSLDKIETLRARRLHPGHGGAIDDPAARVQTLRDHRQRRTSEILAQLGRGVTRIPDLVACIYTDVAPDLHAAAARNVHAHLIELWENGCVTADPDPAPDAGYNLANSA
ncbi:MBL fold metallo-hydrolase [Roseinatronobacter sp. S2]|uniref:MBL fold metallo-hydrolase n=1 Tax=Roseinatronobacter sp. S2 TaxID=3035471 RepID=UPI00240F81B0|nr:MBL fold metallo-hydrolase [Roseinatronobacter sp. S2]WFE75217.1 MBL fold metallo-hydrolase [Roseinatronobacter sp. S2]